jgi:hypothetical protein
LVGQRRGCGEGAGEPLVGLLLAAGEQQQAAEVQQAELRARGRAAPQPELGGSEIAGPVDKRGAVRHGRLRVPHERRRAQPRQRLVWAPC